MKGFIGGIPVALLAVAAQAKFVESQARGTAIGGPSGNDGEGGFISPNSASFKADTQVNEWDEDDHSVKVKHTDAYPRPPVVPVPFGHPGFSGRPQVPGMGPFGKRGEPSRSVVFSDHPHHDEDQGFHLSVTDASSTEVNDYNKDDHSTRVKHEDVHPHGPAFIPFRRSENHGPPAHGAPRMLPHPEPHHESHTDSHYEPHTEPHFVNHPEPHYAPHYSPSYEPHYEPHTTLEHDLTSLEGNNKGPSAGKISFSRRGFPTPPGPHFEPHPESHYESHTESHYEPHPEPHYVNHPEPHTENHPEPHYAPHYSPSYEPHYEPHTTLEHDLTSLEGNNKGPSAGKISFSRRGFPTPPGPHFEPHPEPHYESHSESHYEPHPEPHYVNHPEPHTTNHPEPHYAPHYSPSYEPHYEPHTTVDDDITSLKNNNQGPSAGSISFSRRAYAPAADDNAGTSGEDGVEASQCAAQVHEVVRTVTKTQYKTAEATHFAYQSAPVIEASAIPVHAPQHSAGADPMMNPNPASAPVPTSAVFSHSPQHLAGADPLANSAPASYNQASQRPVSQAGSYSMIPVHVPMATPVSHGILSKPTPSGAFAEQQASPSSSASSSVSHGIMFEGDAARLSGGILSAAAAVMGVLAFIL
ncbi:uncharacterized protein N7500_005062 [Penicillium coprophilum]|uniref:uncharacterized protein n=1 Tax=Penicillium coprophilum TaxID=36646 RepID=UPI002386745B|nr:uncharacterized protein N7500_005062 [Penicillium coprophilum]KAJ5163232.1 hypothetical protein N7500_005062 [Penicillium coprophilum]